MKRTVSSSVSSRSSSAGSIDPTAPSGNRNPSVGGGFASLDAYGLADGGGYEVQIDFPGVVDEDVAVSMTGDKLTVEVKRKRATPAGAEPMMIETFSGTATRELQFPAGIDSENVTAKMRDGVLFVKVPRSTEPARTIPLSRT